MGKDNRLMRFLFAPLVLVLPLLIFLGCSNESSSSSSPMLIDSAKIDSESMTIKERFADRRFLRDVLLKAFGPTSKETLDAEIWQKPHIFGYPCDPNEEIWIQKGLKREKKKQLFDDEVACPRGKSDARVKFFPTDDLIHRASMQRACKILANSMHSVEWGNRKFSVENAKTYFNVFYPYKSFDESIYEKIDSSLTTQDPVFKWRNYLLALCLSEDWQRI